MHRWRRAFTVPDWSAYAFDGMDHHGVFVSEQEVKGLEGWKLA